LGFEKEQMIVIPMAGRTDPDKVKTFKNELLLDPEIVSTSSSNAIPGMRIHVLGIRLPDLEDENLEENEEGEEWISIRVLSTDVDVVKTFGLEMADGRDFSRDFPNDPENAFLINEAAARSFELENPVGARMEYNYGMEENKKGHIVGVVKDFHYASLHTEVEPLMIHIYPQFDRYLSIRIQSTNIQNTLDKLSDKWTEAFPTVPFDHFFLDSYYNNMYKTEMNMGKIIAYFTVLAIIIACLGLFGLAAYITEQRTKEIGIRKVLGASVSTIIQTLSREFVILVLIANLLAWIPAWYFLGQWLDGFVFRTGLSWWLFILSAVISLAISLLIVGFQAYRSARMNPVDAIKYE